MVGYSSGKGVRVMPRATGHGNPPSLIGGHSKSPRFSTMYQKQKGLVFSVKMSQRFISFKYKELA